MFVEPVGKEELMSLINRLKSSKCPGPDNIGPSLVKSVIFSIIDPLLYIYNLSLATGTVPDQLKIAKVVPMFKKGNRLSLVTTDQFHY